MRSTPLIALLLAGCPPGEEPIDPCVPLHPNATIDVRHGPFVQPTADGYRLRFETLSHDAPLALYVGDPSCPAALTPTTDTVDRSFRWPNIDGQLGLDFPDEPGAYTRQDVVFDSLDAGEWMSWQLPFGPDPSQVIEGTFRAPPAAGEAFRVAFVGDTMSPNKADTLPALATHSPDLFLHGGDIQYQSFPGDTWNEFFVLAADALQSGLFAPCIGNHEHEGQNEIAQMYGRLFEGQGQRGTADWFSFDYSGVRFISLSSEEALDDAADAQIVWLNEQLDTMAESGSTRAVVMLHRPIYTLGEHEPKLGIRAQLEAAFDGHDVPLVLTGHNHFYERFDTGTRTVLVDGGGGAFLYDANEHFDDFPDDQALRQAVSETYGFTVLDFAASGSIELLRYDVDGNEVDQAVIGG